MQIPLWDKFGEQLECIDFGDNRTENDDRETSD